MESKDGLNKVLNGESGKREVESGELTKVSRRDKIGRRGRRVWEFRIRDRRDRRKERRAQAAKADELGQEALEGKLKGSVNKEQLMERIKRSDSRGVFSDLELNELAEFEDSCFQHFDSEITEQKDNKRRALGERLDEVDAGKTPSRLKDEKDIDLMR
ncbi:MAG TPA: hypothetical protein GX532_04840 [Clostridia bacterium]|jgi:hypothetical protein|nr:hypothetical protein [Clostridia bacterium]